jgi:hypothetical protein
MQYRLRTLLILLAFASICLGGMVWRWKLDQGALNWFYSAAGIVDESPYWVPVVFGAYAIGRREMTVPFICAFAVAEAGAVYAVIWLMRAVTP